MRRILLCALLVVLPLAAFAPDTEEVQDGLSALLDAVDLSAWDDWFAGQDESFGTFVPSDFLNDTVETGGSTLSAKTLYDRLQRAMREDVYAALGRLAIYVGLGVLCALFAGLSPQGGAAHMAEPILRIVTGCAVLATVFPYLWQAQRTLTLLHDTGEVLTPILLSFLILCGMEASGALLTPTMALLADGVIGVMTRIVLPVALIGGVLCTVDPMQNGRVASIGKLCHRLCRWGVGVLSSLYLAVTAIRGVVATNSDSLLLRTTKLAAGSLPVVGGLVSDSVETAYQCLVLVRSTLGVTGILVLLLLCVKPILALFLQQCALKVGAVIARMFGTKAYAETLDGMGNTLGVALLCVIAVLVMYLACVGLLMGVLKA